jgi:hypothetical protein
VTRNIKGAVAMSSIWRTRRARCQLWSAFFTVSLLAGGSALTAPSASAQGVNIVKVWQQVVADGTPISLSSPNVAVLHGQPAVVVGDRDGHVYAYYLSNGAPVPGWPASTGGIPVYSTPSVAALSPGSPDDSVFVGVGSSAQPHQGGYEAFRPSGSRLWYVAVKNPASDHHRGATAAVLASLSVGDLQGSTDVVAPSVGQEEYALNAATGATLQGFPWFTSDSGFSTPALADLYGTGQLEIVEGGDQTAGISYGVRSTQGGHLRILSSTGNAGTGKPQGGLKCENNLDQVIESSPAVGPFLAGGAEGIVVGTGTYWPGAAATDKILAFNTHCQVIWEDQLDGATTSSPALADVTGTGRLDVVEGTNNHHGGGSIYALNGKTGSVLWRQAAPGEIMGGVVTVDPGQGYQDVIAGGTGGTVIMDGRSGRVIGLVQKYVGLQNSALVTDDPNGAVGITVAGYNAHNQGTVEHFEVQGSHGAQADEQGAWPMFHHDPQLTGNVEGPVLSPLGHTVH